MPINAYTGLPGSGKSYEVVSSVILKAVADGRRVVTNVDGIDGDAVRAYVHDKRGISFDRLGRVIHVTNEQVEDRFFFPFEQKQVDGENVYSDEKAFVKGGDLVCIDEAWRFWGTAVKIQKEHAVFFREHRHFVDPQTRVSCDLVLMVQDISDLNRVLKVVVELNFRTTKIKSLGLSKTYKVEMWEGYKQAAKNRASVETKKYDPEIFPLYSSYSGGAGKEVVVDNRQNLLAKPAVWLGVAAVVLGLPLMVWWSGAFFGWWGKKPPVAETVAASAPSSAPVVPAPTPVVQTPAVAPAPPALSAEWRIAGVVRRDGQTFVALKGPRMRVRYESPSLFTFVEGRPVVGIVDGQRVTTYSGQEGGGPAPSAPSGMVPVGGRR